MAIRELTVQTDAFLTVPEAAKVLGKPKMTLYRWIGADKLIAITFGGILFVPKSEVDRLKGDCGEQLPNIEATAVKQ